MTIITTATAVPTMTHATTKTNVTTMPTKPTMTTMSRRRGGRWTRPWCGLVAIVIVGAITGTATACKVPVFRYALERWTPAPYRIVVLAAGGMPRTDPRLAGGLAGGSAGLAGAGRRPIATLDVVDASQPLEGELAAAWAAHGDRGPVAVVHYPRLAPASRGRGDGFGRVAHAAPLDEQTAAGILSSPARTQIARHLAAGAAAVWVLLETSDAAANAAARQTLEQALNRDRDTIRLPDATELEIDPAVLEQVRIPLGIDFPLVRVARDDVREAFLVDCLLGSEEDLRDYDEPIAFPVFGRGVVLHAIVGWGITADNVEAANAFITGACSCVVKEQNPGFDLLLDVDWDAAVGDVLVSEPPAPTGTAPKLLTIPPGSRR